MTVGILVSGCHDELMEHVAKGAIVSNLRVGAYLSHTYQSNEWHYNASTQDDRDDWGGDFEVVILEEYEET